MHRIRTALVFAIASSLVGCQSEIMDLIEAQLPPEDLDGIHATLQTVQDRDFETARSLFHSSVQTQDRGDDEAWADVADALGDVDLSTLDVLGFNVTFLSGQRTTSLTYEGETSGRWVRIQIALVDGDLYALNAVPAEESLIETNRFRLGDFGTSHAFVLGYGFLALLFAGYACYRVALSGIKRRVLWAIFSFVMVGQAMLAWPTGEVGFRFLQLQIPPVTFTKVGPGAPWIVAVGFPLFAIIALAKVRRHEANRERPDEPV